MGVALFIVAEREVPGLDVTVNGKALGRHTLARLATRLGVRPLMDFFSIAAEEAEAVYEGDPAELPGGGFPPEQWFSPEEGLATVQALLEYATAHPEAIPNGSAIAEDLRQFEAVLSGLAAAGVRWHLAVDS